MQEPFSQERRLTHDKVIIMINDALRGHEDRIIARMDSRMLQIENTIKDGFPNGDPLGHRRVHEQRIEEAEGWKKIRAGAISHLVNYGLIVMIIWVAIAVWQSFKDSIR